jgi:hypothetical protein
LLGKIEKGTGCPVFDLARAYLVVYSGDWKGMWAAGICISRMISANLREYGNRYFIFKWEDKNGDSTPQIAEISMVISG